MGPTALGIIKGIEALGSVAGGAASLAKSADGQPEQSVPVGQPGFSGFQPQPGGFNIAPPPPLSAPQNGNLMDLLKQYTQR